MFLRLQQGRDYCIRFDFFRNFRYRTHVKKPNIVLIGFRGAGKTSFGREIARLAGLPFADLDAEVEFLIGETIDSFVDKHGWQVFREVEQRVAHDFSRNFSGILATGGGTIENSKNLQNLKKTGTFVFLNPKFSDVKKYLLSEKNTRPQLNPEVPLAQEIDMMWNQRKDIYAATAEIQVHPDINGDLSVESQKIIDQISPRLMPNKPKPKKVVILSSSGGTTFQGLLDVQKKGRIPTTTFEGFITNEPECGALKKAQKAGIKRIEILPEDKDLTKEEYDRELINILRDIQPDYILLAGWMKILSPLFCEQFGSITLNVHPSLLPKYAGMKGPEIHEKVVENEDKYSGCTIHRISAEIDGGEMVCQRKVPIDPTDGADVVQQKVQRQEILGFAEVLERR